MKFGMLWFDDDKKRKTEDKVQRAADYYRQKYGEQPTECSVHPSVIAAGAPEHVGAVKVIGRREVQRHHFWLGKSESAEVKKQD